MTEGRLFDTVALIGIGLIGSSLARVIRRDGLAREIVACARRDSTLETVTGLGLADRVTKDHAEAARGADIVVISTPIGTNGAIAEGHRAGPSTGPDRDRCRLREAGRYP